MAKKHFYAVVTGRQPGIYSAWDGEQGAAIQVQGFTGAKYKGFASREDAQDWLDKELNHTHPEPLQDNIYRLYTDGSCLKNPGPGGYGVIITRGKYKQELSAGFRLTTNNRMELLACIISLKAVQTSQTIEVYTDSSYLVNGITKGWAAGWQVKGWMRNKTQKVINADLWEELLSLTQQHTVTFHKVSGHAGHPENERCDQLAKQAASQGDLPPDPGYHQE